MANAISVAGFALAVYGAGRISTAEGIAEIGGGRTLDLADGFVARRTHSSEFGGLLDASLDKAAMAVILTEAWRQHAVPEAVIAAVAMFNIINAATNTYAKSKGEQTVPSAAGKHAMFGHNLALGLFLIGHVTGNTELDVSAWGAAAASIPSSIRASYGYTKRAMQAKTRDVAAQPPKRNYQYQRR